MKGYRAIYDGEEVEAPNGLARIACCDCGLVHTFQFTVRRGGGVKLRAWRDNRATARKRRVRGIQIINGGNKG